MLARIRFTVEMSAWLPSATASQDEKVRQSPRDVWAVVLKQKRFCNSHLLWNTVIFIVAFVQFIAWLRHSIQSGFKGHHATALVLFSRAYGLIVTVHTCGIIWLTRFVGISGLGSIRRVRYFPTLRQNIRAVVT